MALTTEMRKRIARAVKLFAHRQRDMPPFLVPDTTRSVLCRAVTLDTHTSIRFSSPGTAQEAVATGFTLFTFQSWILLKEEVNNHLAKIYSGFQVILDLPVVSTAEEMIIVDYRDALNRALQSVLLLAGQVEHQLGLLDNFPHANGPVSATAGDAAFSVTAG